MEGRTSSVSLRPAPGDVDVHDLDAIAVEQETRGSIVIGQSHLTTDGAQATQAMRRPSGPIGTAVPTVQPQSQAPPAAPARAVPSATGTSPAGADLQTARHGPDHSDSGITARGKLQICAALLPQRLST